MIGPVIVAVHVNGAAHVGVTEAVADPCAQRAALVRRLSDVAIAPPDLGRPLDLGPIVHGYAHDHGGTP